MVNGSDISEVVEQVTWSGDVKQVSRTLTFSVAQKHTDRWLPKVSIESGNQVIFSVGGTPVFGGVVFDIDRSAASDTMTFLAYDLMFYINQSEISKIFEAAPEDVAAQVCSELGVPFGSAASTGMELYLPCLQKTGYQAIMMAYTAASRQNGKKYIPLIKNTNQIHVIEKGTLCGVRLDGDLNLTDATYKTSLQKLVNKVLLVDKNNNVVSTAEDSGSRQKYGTVQKIVKASEDDKALKTEDMSSLFFDLEHSASVSAISDVRAVSGYSLQVYEPITSLCGKFYIDADTHTFSNGQATMQLTLAFKNMMDEMDSDSGGESNAE